VEPITNAVHVRANKNELPESVSSIKHHPVFVVRGAGEAPYSGPGILSPTKNVKTLVFKIEKHFTL
jgi:hypothetical protein